MGPVPYVCTGRQLGESRGCQVELSGAVLSPAQTALNPAKGV